MNWSLSATSGGLLNPGSTPQDNISFLFHLAAIISGVNQYSAACSIAHSVRPSTRRNEAPPAIISAYLGDQLTAIVGAIVSGGQLAEGDGGIMRLGVEALPPLTKDPTDRNRTSPFAFTGNKFEFRQPARQALRWSTRSCVRSRPSLSQMGALLEGKLSSNSSPGQTHLETIKDADGASSRDLQG